MLVYHEASTGPHRPFGRGLGSPVEAALATVLTEPPRRLLCGAHTPHEIPRSAPRLSLSSCAAAEGQTSLCVSVRRGSRGMTTIVAPTWALRARPRSTSHNLGRSLCQRYGSGTSAMIVCVI